MATTVFATLGGMSVGAFAAGLGDTTAPKRRLTPGTEAEGDEASAFVVVAAASPGEISHAEDILHLSGAIDVYRTDE
jgi:hypothetical protein